MSFTEQDLQALDAFTSGDTEAINRLAEQESEEQRAYNEKMNKKFAALQMEIITEVMTRLNPTLFFDPNKPLRDQDPSKWMVETLKVATNAAEKGVKLISAEVTRLAMEAELKKSDD